MYESLLSRLRSADVRGVYKTRAPRRRTVDADVLGDSAVHPCLPLGLSNLCCVVSGIDRFVIVELFTWKRIF